MPCHRTPARRRTAGRITGGIAAPASATERILPGDDSSDRERIISPPSHRQRRRVRPGRAAIAPMIQVDQPQPATKLMQRPVQRVVHTETAVQHQHRWSLTDHLDVDPVNLHAQAPLETEPVPSAQRAHVKSRPSENNADTTRWSRRGLGRLRIRARQPLVPRPFLAALSSRCRRNHRHTARSSRPGRVH